MDRLFTVMVGVNFVDKSADKSYTFFDVVRIKLFNIYIFDISYKRKDDEKVIQIIFLGLSLFLCWHNEEAI